MNIWLPIVTNLIIISLLIISIVVGRKNGFKVEFAKLLILLPLLIGTYFLIPILSREMLEISFLNGIKEDIMKSSLWLILFILEYGLVNIIVYLVRKRSHKDIKPVKVKGLNKKSTRELRKQEKELAKLNETQASKMNKGFGCLVGLIIGILGTFIMMLPCKYIFNKVAEDHPEIEQIKTGYKYTAYGQLDEITDEKITKFLVSNNKEGK